MLATEIFFFLAKPASPPDLPIPAGDVVVHPASPLPSADREAARFLVQRLPSLIRPDPSV